MSWDVRRAVPIYRKFLLENKILLFFTCLLVFLCSVTLIAVYWANQDAVSEVLSEGAGDRAAARAALIAVLLVVMPGTLLIGIARVVIRKAVSPLKDLTRVADEISAGNLDPSFDFGVHVNCWEIKNCQRTDCDAYQNFSQQCWYIDGTPCEGYESRFPQKLEGCRTCDVYQAHRGDEVVQLADSFRHMANSLKASQQQLVDADDFQKRLIQNSFNGIIAANADGIVNIFNQVAEALVGIPRTEAIGHMHWHAFLDAELERAMDIPISHEPVRRVRGFAPREATIKRVDGRRIDVRLAGISLFERGIHIGKVFFFEDMREVKQLREDLIQSERLAAAGQAAAGISHSIKNIMDGFNGGVYVYRIGRKRRDEDKMTAGFGMIERNVKIISDLANDLLNFAKERRPLMALQDPRQLVEDVIAAAGPPREERISVRIVQKGPVQEVMLDRHAIHQCLSNLLDNAVGAFAVGETGHIVVEIGSAGDNVYIAVRDDGMGMSPRTIDKIRGGMYSTKGSKGTGLGLQVVQKIVKEHRGTLIIESEEGRGSTFRIEIPAGAETDQPVPPR
ncbi:HAMP domain-containing protein [bacterium]|nr:HAMP domain-containing protein [bacterium]